MDNESTTGTLEYVLVEDGQARQVVGHIINEMLLSVYVNGRELVTVVCSPGRLHALVLGFLLSEGLIESLDDVLLLRVCMEEGMAEVRLAHEVNVPPSRVLTSGCGGGMTFADLKAVGGPITSRIALSPARVTRLAGQLNARADSYRRSRGIHTAALSDGERILVVVEDIGRHNTLDRLRGEMLLQGIDPTGKVILSSGRVTSEMLRKAAQMGVPIVISRTSPSSLSVELADAWGITLIGYAQGRRFRVYAHPWRIA